MTEQQRLNALKDFLGLSYNAISKQMGRKNPQIFYDIESGKCKISRKFAQEVADNFLNISFSWLLTGEGEMLRDNKEVGSTTISHSVVGNSNSVMVDSDLIASYKEQIRMLKEQVEMDKEQIRQYQEQVSGLIKQLNSLVEMLKNK